MGSTYVFIEQYVHESLVVYARGSGKLYRKLLVWHSVAFCGGAILSSAAASWLYVAQGPTSPFYIGAGVVAVAA
eukprot:14379128-Heterocapsa_arctica.AAC.1